MLKHWRAKMVCHALPRPLSNFPLPGLPPTTQGGSDARPLYTRLSAPFAWWMRGFAGLYSPRPRQIKGAWIGPCCGYRAAIQKIQGFGAARDTRRECGRPSKGGVVRGLLRRHDLPSFRSLRHRGPRAPRCLRLTERGAARFLPEAPTPSDTTSALGFFQRSAAGRSL